MDGHLSPRHRGLLRRQVLKCNVFLAESPSSDILAMSRFPFLVPWVCSFLNTSAVVMPLYQNVSWQAMVSWAWRVPLLLSGIAAIFPILLFACEAEEASKFQEVVGQAQEEEDGAQDTRAFFLVEVWRVWGQTMQDSWKAGAIATGGMLFKASLEAMGDNYLKYWLAKWCGLSAAAAAKYTIYVQLVYI